ncbi:hypothetical protein REPUB_Repub05bG0013300 [Reevesia pubescens]
MSLSLCYNELQGKLPEDIFRFPYLQKLKISSQSLLEVKFPKTNWSSPLRSLDFSRVIFLPEEVSQPSFIGNLRFLEVMDLSFCNLNGSIPESFGNLTRLTSLDLSGNNIIGQLPSWFSNFNQLRYLDLSENQLHGQIPDAFGNLTKLFHLSLCFNQFSERLPFSVFNLPNIVYLDMSQNKLVGSLPSQVSGLSLLSELDLSGNLLNGRIPPWLFTLPSLSDLRLYDNKFSGLIDQFEQPATSILEYVYLQNNEIHGPIPSSVFALVNLTLIHLSSNKLTSIFEPHNLPKLNKLKYLYLSNNTLLSSVKFHYLFAPNLFFLSLSACNISEFPHFVRNLEGLKGLNLSYNNICVIEADMFSKLENLTFLDLSHNSELALNTTLNLPLPNLYSLGLSSCNMTEFPDFLRTLENLYELDLSYNNIHGKISKGQSEGWHSLGSIDLSNNFLTDIEHYPWKNVETLNLGSNQLGGSVLVPPPSTRVFIVSKNRLKGKLPSSICSLKSLETLDLSENNLSGTLPNCLGAFNTTLKILDLRRNKFHGNIPDSFVKGNMLRTIDFSSNDLDGPLPKSLMNCSGLQVLNVGNNKINDTFPHWLGALPVLDVFVLCSNNFHGIIINSNYGSLFPNLQIFDLSSNDLDGPLPKSLMNCSKLQVLNVGNNKINDTFPHWLGALPVLKVLVLRSNNFHGVIINPNNGSLFPNLQIFDLSHNEFSGSLPTYFESFKSMMNLGNVEIEYIGDLKHRVSMNSRNFGLLSSSYYHDSVLVTMKGVDFIFERVLTIFVAIDLSSNQFEGEIPEIVGKLTALKVLNFSHNNLTGCIPSTMANLTELESLDLSSNKLVGQIPTQLASLRFLEVLNLSQNQLVGPIPLGTQFNTFSNDSYTGNLGLCGFPLSKKCGKTEAETPVFHEDADSESEFEWKVALMGYGSGLVLGISTGYIIFTLGKPKWLVKMVERAGYKLNICLKGRRMK